jgi:uncharacterized membrane protein YtjA (UPF0391 family)
MGQSTHPQPGTSGAPGVYCTIIGPVIARRLFPAATTILKHITPMLSWVLTFLVIALIAGAFGFTGIAGTSIGIAQTLFYIFLILFLLSLIVHIIRGSGPKSDL